MHRQVAKLLLLVLLEGTFAPFAAAALSIEPGQRYCHRKPLESPPAEMPCHHHVMAGMNYDATVAKRPDEPAFDSKSCCEGHQCCRSLLRSQWAQVIRRSPEQLADPARPLIQVPRPGFRTSDFALSLQARAPPSL